MKTRNSNQNIDAVRRFYKARGNPEIVHQVLASGVRWEVVPGFPHSDVYHGLNGVADFFSRLFGDFEEWHTEPSEIVETGDHVFAIGTYSARAKARGKTFRRSSRISGRCATASSFDFNNAPTPCNSRRPWAKI